MQNAEPLENLADQFARFPGIGRKGAVRMAYEVMSMSNEQAMELAKAIENAKVKLHRCRLCQDYTANEVCSICASPKRDRSVICVVESPRDVKAIERTHEFNGLYHVLHGLISPMDGIGADQILLLRQRQRTKKRRDVQFGHALVLRALFDKDLLLRKKLADALARTLGHAVVVFHFHVFQTYHEPPRVYSCRSPADAVASTQVDIILHRAHYIRFFPCVQQQLVRFHKKSNKNDRIFPTANLG